MSKMKMIERERKFNKNWKFIKGDFKDASKKDCCDNHWQTLNLPHDWSIEGAFAQNNPSGSSGGYLPGGIGWYRKYFIIDKEHEGKKAYINFGGIYHNSKVWVNGNYIGKRPSGYVSFQYDITSFINFGSKNIISVRVDNTDHPNCRWYTGSGIYRSVHLIITDKLHVTNNGTYITTSEVSETEAKINIKTEVKNEYSNNIDCTLKTTIFTQEGKCVQEVITDKEVLSEAKMDFEQELEIFNPNLWSIESPELYYAKSEVLINGELKDEYKTTFGIRKIRFDKDEGFFLNGKNIKMKGVNLHHDAGCLGAAVPKLAWKRRLETLKEMGCNAIRASHNPPAVEFLDLCDEMGFLVIDEAFDKWRDKKLAASFKDWWQQDLESMLKRDRNHPSIIIWSVGNEVLDVGSDEMTNVLKQLTDYVRKEDPGRPVTFALQPAIGAKTHKEHIKIVKRLSEYIDILSLNYQEQWYEDYKAAIPDAIIVGSECYGFFRGTHDRYKAFSPQNPWFDVEEKNYVIGQFLWAGIDYLGEVISGWPSKGWSASPIDTCGFRKPRSFFHQSVWSEDPMVHIGVYNDKIERNHEKPHWSWPKIASHWNFTEYEDEVIKLVTYTNCESVELFVNEESYGVKYLSDYPNKMIEWYVPHKEGEIKAIGRNGGEIVCDHQIKTAGKPATILLTPDRKNIKADGNDLCHVKVEIVDSDGVLVPEENSTINFYITGPGQIVGVDNGNLLSNELYKVKRRKAHHGKCLVIVQSKEETGEIQLTAEIPGLFQVMIEILAQ